MPSFHVYGIHSFLELRDLSSNPATTTSRVSESPPILKWSPMQGMTHPISTTTVFSPAKPAPHPAIPFCIVVEFDPDSPCTANHQPPSSDHLKGDVRIEVKIDDVVRGWKVLPQAKIWPKGIRIEFSGSRVGRTEERAFVFNPLLLGSGTKNHRARTFFVPTPTPTPAPATGLHTVWDSRDPALVPLTPPGLPPNTSHIEILITLGKKHNTLEKYLIFSPVLQEAFYIPPSLTSSPFRSFEGGIPGDNKGMKRKAGVSPRKKKELKATTPPRTPYPPPTTTNEEQLREPEGHDLYTEMGAEASAIEWRPVGLAGNSQKTAQMREAEFTARIHLARFWFIIAICPRAFLIPSLAPEPTYLPPQTQTPITPASLASFDGQQDANPDDILTYNEWRVRGKARDGLGKHGHIRLEGSALLGERRKRKTIKKIWNTGIHEFLPGNPQAQERDSRTRKQVLGTHKTRLFPDIVVEAQHPEGLGPIPKISHGPGSEHNSRVLQKKPETMPREIGSLTGFIKPIGERINSQNPEIGRWTTKTIKIEKGN